MGLLRGMLPSGLLASGWAVARLAVAAEAEGVKLVSRMPQRRAGKITEQFAATLRICTATGGVACSSRGSKHLGPDVAAHLWDGGGR